MVERPHCTEAPSTFCILHSKGNESLRAGLAFSFVLGSRLTIETKGFTSGSEELPSRDRFSERVTVIMPLCCEQEGKCDDQATDGDRLCRGNQHYQLQVTHEAAIEQS